MDNFDVIVIGGGHAGCEAAHASAKIGVKTALITANINNIAAMPCNPSIGGPAKGIVVREIDAMGGLMGVITDQTAIQMKMLNLSKGPGVWSLRAQTDRLKYPRKMIEILKNTSNLTIVEDFVDEIVVEGTKVHGVKLASGIVYATQAVVITTGTYMKSTILVGHEKRAEGPHGEQTKSNLSQWLQLQGFELFRLKTGTPPRVERDSIDFSKVEEQPGDIIHRHFSEWYDGELLLEGEQQLPCYLTYTNEATHEIINKHLDDSAMYSGNVKGVGPRYCPSIEDKIVRFSDKNRHQLFLEPESLEMNDYYIQGFSTSMPHEIQQELLKTIPGLENAVINKYGYAIEYDAINPIQLQPTLETKLISGLFSAGQVNGTSGYEEAAGQGIIAGINAARFTKNVDQIVLKRDEAYIGVMIDDLVTKGTLEPYRLLTSRAEHRLMLRHDNAIYRLFEIAKAVGMYTTEQIKRYENRVKIKEELIDLLSNTKLTPKQATQEFLNTQNSAEIRDGIDAYALLKRPEIDVLKLCKFLNIETNSAIAQEVAIISKYSGYIKKANRQTIAGQKLDNKKIPEEIDYAQIPNLALEARQKLDQIKPQTLGQASRISGVNPSDVAIINVYIKKFHGRT